MIENGRVFIKRDAFFGLKEHLSKPEITVIIGPRQVGKTTLMRELENYAKSKLNLKTIFINLDVESGAYYMQTQEVLLSKARLEFGDERGVIFIDELQRKKDAGRFLKGLFDMNLGYKFVVSSSGNIELKESISESLMGRKKLFFIGPVSWREFVDFKTQYKYSGRLDDFFEVEPEKRDLLFNEYLQFGGYPKVILSSSLQEKLENISEIYTSYINKDIINWLRLEKIDSFEKIVKLISTNIGNLIEYSELARLSGASVQTVRNYLWYLEKTFILRRLTPFYTNKNSEITKQPLFYFYDLGLRNFIAGEFGSLNEISPQIGFLFENYILNTLSEYISNTSAKLHYWRSKSQAEVDFVLQHGNKLIPIEAKYTNISKPKIPRSLRSFISKYAPENAYIITKGYELSLFVEDTQIDFLPYYKLQKIAQKHL